MALVQELRSLVDQLVNNGLGRLLLVDHSSGLTHQVRTSVVNVVIVNVVGHVLKVVLNGDNTLASELLDFLGAVLLPVLDVFVLADTEGTALKRFCQFTNFAKSLPGIKTYSEDDGADSVVEASGTDSLLVSLRSTGLISQDETGTDPDGRSTQHQGSRDGGAVVQTTSGNNLHGLAGHGALVALAQLGNSGDEQRGGHGTSVTTTFTTLSTDEIRTGLQRLLHVLGVTDHVHVEDAVAVKTVDNVAGRDTDSRDEKLRTTLDDNVDQFVELTLGVIVAGHC